MKQQQLAPRQYHSLKFDISQLPDLKKAGHISASILSAARNPLKMVLCQREETGEMQWGSLVDCLWTTPGQFAAEYAVLPEDAPRDVRGDKRIMNAKKPSRDSLDAIKWWQGHDAANAGKTPIKQAQLEEAKMAVSMLNQNDLARQIWEQSQKQVALVGDSPYVPEAKAKCLMDLLPMEGSFVDAICDLKTTGQMGEGQLLSTAFTFDYIFKLAYYGVLAELAGFGPRPRGVIIWQNASFPFEVKTRELPQTQMSAIRAIILRRHQKLASINPADMRPHFDTTLKETPLPDWAMNAYMQE
jgi:exodeoxyribonuclease VIII